jgi:hypothetical protein
MAAPPHRSFNDLVHIPGRTRTAQQILGIATYARSTHVLDASLATVDHQWDHVVCSS